MNAKDFQFYPISNGKFHYNINTIITVYTAYNNNYIKKNIMVSGIGKDYKIYYNDNGPLSMYIDGIDIFESYENEKLAKQIKNHIYEQLTQKKNVEEEKEPINE
jgi:hypothetical protein